MLGQTNTNGLQISVDRSAAQTGQLGDLRSV
jgi:hypothetical protein